MRDILKISVCEFVGISKTLDLEASYDQTVSIRRRWSMIVNGIDSEKIPALLDWLYQHPELLPDLYTYEEWADATVELINSACTIARDVFVEGF